MTISYAPATGIPTEKNATLRDYWSLLKPGVMSLVVFTGFVGLWMAPGHIQPLLGAITVLAIAMGSGGGAAINMWYDRDIDGRMKRTAKRAIPSGRVSADDALFLGIALSIASVMLLALAGGLAAAGLLAFAIWFYAIFYTMGLKRRTPQNIVIGGAAGAFPALIGWLAVTPYVAPDPVWYFLIVFLWTPPHFWALALYRSGDYRDVGIPMMPVVAGVGKTKRLIFAYSVLLFASGLLPSLAGRAGWLYLAGAAGLGGYFLWLALRVWRSERDADAMGLFKYSILYLFMLFSLLIVDKTLHYPLHLARFFQ